VANDFRLREWVIQPSLNSVSRNGASVHLEPKVMKVLVCLANRAGETLPKEELLKTVWPDTFVTDDGLVRAISELRRVFEDDVREPRFIQTIPKRGYRLVAPVEHLAAGAGVESALQISPPGMAPAGNERRRRSRNVLLAATLLLLAGLTAGLMIHQRFSRAAYPAIHSLAVLPLQNLSSDASQEYFSDGLTDGLITDLAQIGSIRVISRTSSMQYKGARKSLPEIARELGVDGIVEGTVQRSGDRVRISAQLIYGPGDKHLWANTYERDARDVFALEREVTEEIARQVQARLGTANGAAISRPLPVAPKALDLYLQGRYYVTRGERGLNDQEKEKAADYFQQAIAIEPNFVPAYLGLAEAYNLRVQGSKEDVTIRKRAAEKALSLDPNSSQALTELANIRWNDFDWRGAEQEYRQAVEIGPSDAEAHDELGGVLAATGRLDEALREAQVAQQLDPNGDHLAEILRLKGDDDGAIALLRDEASRHPEDAVTHFALYRSYAHKGSYKEAADELADMMRLIGRPHFEKSLRDAYTASGFPGTMREFAKELEGVLAAKQGFFPENLAVANTALGNNDRAFYWLEQAYEHRDVASHDNGLTYLKVEPLLAPLHSDPRFANLLRRIGLPP